VKLNNYFLGVVFFFFFDSPAYIWSFSGLFLFLQKRQNFEGGGGGGEGSEHKIYLDFLSLQIFLKILCYKK